MKKILKSKVKRAKDLKLCKLGLSQSTQSKLAELDLLKPESLVRMGRQLAISLEDPLISEKSADWRKELVNELDIAGYVRHDLYPLTYDIWRLYREIFGEDAVDDLFDDEIYESIRPIYDLELEAIIDIVANFESAEVELLIQSFGLSHDSKPFQPFETAKNSSAQNRKILSKAIEKFRQPKIRDIMPIRFGVRPDRVPEPGIEILDLCGRTYRSLKRAGINTVNDVLNYPVHRWSRIPSIGDKSLIEIELSMREFGYKDFRILKKLDQLSSKMDTLFS